MNLTGNTKQKLQEVMLRDYGVSLSEEEANKFGQSLLRLTRIAIVALARAEENQGSKELLEINN